LGIYSATHANRSNFQGQSPILTPNFGGRPISIWETLILAEKGRISLQADPVTWVNLALKTLETREAQMNHPIAILSRQIALFHQDPADRFIVATAIY